MTDREIDNKINRINKQLAKMVDKLGKNSPYYSKMTTILCSNSELGRNPKLVKYTSAESDQPLQISRSKSAIQILKNDPKLMKSLDKLDKQPKYQDILEQGYQAYRDAHPDQPEIKNLNQRYKKALPIVKDNISSRNLLDDLFQQLYQIQDKLGYNTPEYQELFNYNSQGYNASIEDRKKMIDIIQKALKKYNPPDTFDNVF